MSKAFVENRCEHLDSRSDNPMSIPQIDYEAPLSADDEQILIDHGWEISEDQREARLYSEGWSSIQAAAFSTKWWIEESR